MLTTPLYVPRASRILPSPHYYSPERFAIGYRAGLFGSLFWAVMTGWCVRLTVVALVYKGFLIRDAAIGNLLMKWAA